MSLFNASALFLCSCISRTHSIYLYFIVLSTRLFFLQGSDGAVGSWRSGGEHRTDRLHHRHGARERPGTSTRHVSKNQSILSIFKNSCSTSLGIQGKPLLAPFCFTNCLCRPSAINPTLTLNHLNGHYLLLTSYCRVKPQLMHGDEFLLGVRGPGDASAASVIGRRRGGL